MGKNDLRNLNQTKNQTFVYLYAMAIIMVVDDHCGTCIGINSGLFPYNSFYMPLFVFASGYFFRKRPVAGAIIHRVKKILIPYVIYDIAMIAVAYMIDSVFQTEWFRNVTIKSIVRMLVAHPTTQVNDAAWFAVMLFWVSIVYLLIRILIHQDLRYDLLLTVFLVSCGFISLYVCIYKAACVTQAIRWICKTVFYLQFYHLGYMFHQYYEAVLKKQKRSVVCLVCIAINVILKTIFGDKIIFPGTAGMNHFQSVILPLITSITGILFYYEVMSFIGETIGERREILFISRNTFVVMQLHLLFASIPKLYLLYTATHESAKNSGFPAASFRSSIWDGNYPKTNLISFFCGLFGSLLIAYIIEQSKPFFKSVLLSTIKPKNK